MRIAIWIAVALVVAGAVFMVTRVLRVRSGSSIIPVYAGAREGARHTRYLPRIISWDDRSSARVDRVYAVPAGTTLLAVARHAADSLARLGWYLVTPDDLSRGMTDPQVIVWQHDPDERLDLMQLWPVSGMTREQRLYGGRFPEAFLDEPVVVGWTWALGGPRSPRPSAMRPRAIVRPPIPPPTGPESPRNPPP